MERSIEATPEAVFSVLADGWSYSAWVVGTSHIRPVDAAWPAVGSQIHHAVGPWPAAVRDMTAVEAVEPDRSLILLASGRILGRARIELTLTPIERGTSVCLREGPVAGAGRRLAGPVLGRLLHRRNVETLARLAALAERRTEPDGDLG